MHRRAFSCCTDWHITTVSRVHRTRFSWYICCSQYWQLLYKYGSCRKTVINRNLRLLPRLRKGRATPRKPHDCEALPRIIYAFIHILLLPELLWLELLIVRYWSHMGQHG